MVRSAHKQQLSASVGAFALVVAVALALISPSASLAEQRTTDQIAGAPASTRKVAKAKLPDVSVKSGILVTGDGAALWARKPNDQRPMASITKIMTALIALEKSDPEDIVTVGDDAARPGESTVNLREGQKLPMRELLQGLLVKSGNDAAIAIAEHVAGSTDEFVVLMNQKARALGLKDTHFSNPHGLDAPEHYTSAADLQKLARTAMKNPEFRRIVAMESTTVGGKKFNSTDRLLGSYQGAMGVKTGFTNGAGYSMVAAAERDGRRFYAVVLGDPTDRTRFDDARALLDWGFQHFGERSLMTGGSYLGTVPVRDYLDTSVGVLAAADASATVFDLRGPVERRVELVKGVGAPVKRGTPLGQVVFLQAGREVGKVAVVASRDIPAPTVLERVGITMTRAWRSVFGPHVQPKATVLAAR